MDLTLSDEELMVRDTARRFLEAQCPTRLVRAMEKDAKGYSPDLWRQAAELGWQGMALPERYGGSNLPLVYLGLVFEEVGRTLAPLPLHGTIVTALTLARAASDELRDAILRGVVAGDTVLTWAFSERDPRLLPETVQTRAEQAGDDFVINGAKLFVDSYPAADHILVVCRTAPPSGSNAGLSLFLLDTKTRGLSHTPLTTLAKDKQSEVRFDNVRVPKANLVGPLHEGWPIASRMLDTAVILLCAQMVGATRKDVEMAVEWSKFRKAFDQPIGAFQSIQHMCADMLLWVDGGQILTYEALWRMDQDLPASVEVSQAKAFCNEKCEAAVRQCQVIHGGIGFMMEFDLQLWYRRVCSWTMRLGTAFEHRARIAEALLDHPGQVILGRPVPVIAEA